jgi:hypothetical protein
MESADQDFQCMRFNCLDFTVRSEVHDRCMGINDHRSASSEMSLMEKVGFLTATEARFDRDYRCNPRAKTFGA